MILDASAVLALLRREPGWEAVDAVRTGSSMAAINMAEVVSYYDVRGTPADVIDALLAATGVSIEPVDTALARSAGLLRSATAVAGLSLADRCCLALAKRTGLPAMTADRSWLGVAEAVGVDVRLIR